MTKYRVPLTGFADIVVIVETDETDPEVIAELAEEQARPSLCSSCRGSTSNDHLEIGQEWNAVRNTEGVPELYVE